MPTSVTATEAYKRWNRASSTRSPLRSTRICSFGTIDQAEWWTDNLNPGTVNCPVVVNIDAYEALSDEHRAALDSSVEESIAHYLANYGELLQRGKAFWPKRTCRRSTIATRSRRIPQPAADPIREQWIADMTARACRRRSFMTWS